MANNQDRKYTILVIEDNVINCEILEEMLQDQYSLLFANNGEEGMAMLRKHYRDIEVILLDIQMPVMNGYQVLTAKGKEPLLKEIPVIVTTSSNGSDEEIRCLELGAQDFVRKPYDPFVVRLRIASIINMRESAESIRQKTLFIQNISHEIRTPMNSIMGFAQILGEMADSLSADDLKMFCGSITNSSRDLMVMVDNMVSLSDFDNNSFPLHLTDVSPNQICRDAMEATSDNTPEGVNVCFTSEVDDSFIINSDAKCLELAIYNIISNANKFTSQGEIRIHCAITSNPSSLISNPSCAPSVLRRAELGTSLIISVSDTGIGVPADKSEYIFNRFTKLDDFVPGLGLGLAVTRTIALTLNGSAYLDTTYTGGSRFVIELPIG